ncbi:hypothetical protein [Glutamicibacter ardleyensis]|uniref:hypothetical protein n=1 Tax=Glutamicibacter ardleyensis TaxID=225894 RepID=UPI003FD24F75
MISKKVKIWGSVAAGVIVLGTIGNLLNPQSETSPKQTAIEIPTTTAHEPTSKSMKPAAEPEAPPTMKVAAPQHLAADVEKNWLLNMGVDEPYELLDTLPNSLAGHVASFDDVATGTVEITVQTNNATKSELESFSKSLFSLVGSDLQDLERVEAVTADRLTRGVANRREIPLLNQ